MFKNSTSHSIKEKCHDKYLKFAQCINNGLYHEESVKDKCLQLQNEYEKCKKKQII